MITVNNHRQGFTVNMHTLFWHVDSPNPPKFVAYALMQSKNVLLCILLLFTFLFYHQYLSCALYKINVIYFAWITGLEELTSWKVFEFYVLKINKPKTWRKHDWKLPSPIWETKVFGVSTQSCGLGLPVYWDKYFTFLLLQIVRLVLFLRLYGMVEILLWYNYNWPIFKAL